MTDNLAKIPLHQNTKAVRHECQDIGAVIYIFRNPEHVRADFELYTADIWEDEILYDTWIDRCSGSSTDITVAEPWLEGYVKWDGCVEFDLHEQHFCNHEQIELLWRRFSRVYDLALLAAESGGSFKDDLDAAKDRLTKIGAKSLPASSIE